MRTQLFWIPGPWPGKLAVMSRPRGADWLEDELRQWRSSGVDVLVSLLTDAESAAFDLTREAALASEGGMEFVSYAIPDRDVPSSSTSFLDLAAGLAGHLQAGRTVAIHCRQGIGRSALVAACVLVLGGLGPEEAVTRVGEARRLPVPETAEQKKWITDFARTVSGAASRS